MHKLQNSFKGEIQFLPIAYQDSKTVQSFLDKIQKELQIKEPSVTGDKILSKLFPHNVLPHYVWIGKNGRVLAITGLEDVSSSNIQSMLQKTDFNLPLKKDSSIAYDKIRPLFINGNGGNGSGLIYHSVFSKYVEGLPPGLTVFDKAHGGKIICRNVIILWLLNLAYGEGKRNFPMKNQIILEVKDSSRFLNDATGSVYERWAVKNAYCYELIVPPYLYDERYKIMQRDMQMLFPKIKVTIENRKALCLVLTRIDSGDKLASKGGKPKISFNALGCHIRNRPLSVLFKGLKILYLQNSSLPLMDGTDYQGNIDIDINANMSNVDSINAALKKYGLQFIKDYQTIPFLVIKDRVFQSEQGL